MNKELQDFLDSAKREGISGESVVLLLRGRGWPAADAYRALADHHEIQGGALVPTYRRSGSAKDAFLYLLSFSMLATWTIAVGSILFIVIDRWIKDPLIPDYNYAYGYYQMADSLACVIVAFPIYVFAMRYILKEIRVHPERIDSPVRKWLTYIALLIGAGVLVTDLITFLTYFLRGELTARFVAKVVVVLVISGGVFWYYLGSLQLARVIGKRDE